MQALEAEKMHRYELDLVNSACKNSFLVTSTVKSLAVTASHRGETLIMAELCNSLLHGMMTRRYARLLGEVEAAKDVADNCAFFGDIHVALTCKAGLEQLLRLLDEEADMKEKIVQAAEVDVRNKTLHKGVFRRASPDQNRKVDTF